MSLNSVAVQAINEVVDGLELYDRKAQIQSCLRKMDYNAALFLLKMVQQQDNVLITPHVGFELAAPVRRNAYQLAQVEARIAELAYLSHRRGRTRSRPATHPTRPGVKAGS